MVAYATLAQFYASLDAGVLVASPRAVDLVDVSTSTFRLRSHGLSTGDVFTFEAKGGTVLAPPTSQVQPYQAVRISADLFKATANGVPVVLTGPPTPATGLTNIVIDLESVILTSLEWWSRWADQCLIAHRTPLVVWPSHLTLWVCALAAYDLLVGRGLVSTSFKEAIGEFTARANFARAQLEQHRGGIPLRGAVDQTPATADNAATHWEDTSAPDWNTASVIP